MADVLSVISTAILRRIELFVYLRTWLCKKMRMRSSVDAGPVVSAGDASAARASSTARRAAPDAVRAVVTSPRPKYAACKYCHSAAAAATFSNSSAICARVPASSSGRLPLAWMLLTNR